MEKRARPPTSLAENSLSAGEALESARCLQKEWEGGARGEVGNWLGVASGRAMVINEADWALRRAEALVDNYIGPADGGEE